MVPPRSALRSALRLSAGLVAVLLLDAPHLVTHASNRQQTAPTAPAAKPTRDSEREADRAQRLAMLREIRREAAAQVTRAASSADRAESQHALADAADSFDRLATQAKADAAAGATLISPALLDELRVAATTLHARARQVKGT